MASVGEEDQLVYIPPSTEPALQTGPEIHTTVSSPQAAAAPEASNLPPDPTGNPAVVKPSKPGVLLKVWQARGFFGGLIAIGLAYLGEKVVLEQADETAALRYYVAAFVILILSLAHPTFTALHFLRRKKPSPLPTIEPPAANVSTPSVSNGTHPANGTAALSHSNGSEATESAAIAADDWQTLPQLPVRTARNTLDLSLPVRKARGSSAVALPAGPAQVEYEQAYVPLPSRPAAKRNGNFGLPVSIESNGNGAASAAPALAPARRLFGPRGSSVVARADQPSHARRGLWARWVALRAALGWRLTLPLFLLTLIITAASFASLRASIEKPLGGWLWFAAMLLLVLTFAGAPRWLRALNGLLDGPEEGFFSFGVTRSSFPIEAVFVVIMLAVAILLRIWNLEYLPGIFGDEGERGTDALGLLQGHTDSLFGTGWWDVPNLYFYWLAWSFRIFGATMVGDRIPSVISGVVTIWAVYRIGRLLWGPRVGLLAGALLAVSPLWLQFSREAGESTPTVMFWALGFLFLFRALRFRYWVDWALSGLTFGFSLYFYAAGKMVVPVVAAIGLYLLIRWRWQFIRRYAAGYGLLLVGFALAPMPYLIKISSGNFNAFFRRAQETSIFSPGITPGVFTRYGLVYDTSWSGLSIFQNVLQHPAIWAQVLFNQARVGLEALYRIGDMSFFYVLRNHPGGLLSPVVACLTLLGIVYFVWKFWDARYALLLLWFCAGMLGLILTVDVPTIQRAVDAWPAVFFFPAVVVDRILASAWPLNVYFARRWLLIPVIGLAIFAAVDGYNEYFVTYASQCSFCSATTLARYTQSLGQDYKAYQMGVGGYPVYFVYGSTRFAAPNVEGTDLNVPMDNFPVTDNNNKGLAFLVLPNNSQYLPIINLFYPGGKQENINGTDNSFQFTSFKLSADLTQQFQVTNATYVDAQGRTIRRVEPNLGSALPLGVTKWTPPATLTYPVTAAWKGALVAPDYGEYTFALDGAASAGFLLDGKQVLTSSGNASGNKSITLVLARGLHDVQLNGTLPKSSARVNLRWSGGKGTPQPISANYLYNGPTGGLSGAFSYNSGQPVDIPDPFANQQPFLLQTNSFLSIKDAGAATASFKGRAFFARWQGSIVISAAGQYGFSIQSNGPNMLSIDGKMILNSTNPPANGKSILLTEGPHSVEVRYIWTGQQGGNFEWYWTPPGRTESIVPPTVLRPVARSWPVGAVTVPNSIPNVSPPPPPSAPVTPIALLGADTDLKEARGIGVDSKGQVYIGDNGNHRILVLDADGKTVTQWGGATDASAQGKISLLGDVWTTPAGHTFTLDSLNGDVQEFNPDGSVANYFKGMAKSSGGITVAPDGKIYIANTAANQILVVSPAGKILTQYTGGGPGAQTHFNQPIDVAIGSDGHTVYAVDMNSRIVQLDDNGSIVREWPVQIGYAQGGSHLVYWRNQLVITDPDNDRLDVINPATGEIHLFGVSGSEYNQMHTPVGLAVGSDDKLYVTDSGNNRILVFSDLSTK